MLIIIPGWLITLITFPGVIVHEIAHRLFCDLFHVPVYAIQYFTLFSEDRAGCVIHKCPQGIISAFFISVAPFIVNTIIALFLLIPGLYFVSFHEKLAGYTPQTIVLYRIMLWIGLSTAFHAIPSPADIKSFDELFKEKRFRKLRYIPLLFFISIIAILTYINELMNLASFFYTVMLVIIVSILVSQYLS